ncbi:MAG: hypothetical protein MUC30_03640 [Bacteroidales bacterium]|nr:hypothetical protein [Bacteroidales bacterium]
MDRALLSLFLIFLHTFSLGASDAGICQDTAYLRQQIYNGRVWEKRYNNVYGNEFFLTEALTEASVKINGRVFTGQLCLYDIYNDQLVLMTRPGSYIEANKENIQEFTMVYNNRKYRFVNFESFGYGHVLYQGTLYLAFKYTKEIRKKAIENRFDAFDESKQAYIIRGEEIIKITSKKDLFNALADKETEIKQFLRQTGIHADTKRVETLIPVLEFYDSL